MISRCIAGLSAIAVFSFLWCLPLRAYHGVAGGPIIVNGQELSAQQGQGLMQLYGPIPAGSYWYDTVSGLWGPAGGPSTGQILPNLPMGGPLRANASNSRTGVFVNGREIHYQEFVYLQQLYGVVNPGRYWMNAQLVGGYEGGPPTFDLRAASGGSGGGGGESGYNRNTIGGGLMSDGNCSGYLHPSGASVMTGNC